MSGAFCCIAMATIKIKNSQVKDKAPQPSDLVIGELAINTHADSPAVYLKDTAGAVRKIAGAGAVGATAATDTAQGVVELATAAEVTTGTDTTRAVTPAGLKVELDKKANQATTYTKAETDTALALKAPLASPALTGTPTAPTAAAGTNTTQLATTEFVAGAQNWTRTGTTLAPKTAGDVVTVSAGTAALPGLTPVGDPNTGIYAPAADTLALSTNGTEKVRITSDGKVGIGATAPDAPLVVTRQVSDLIARFGSLATTAGAWIRLQGKDSLGTTNQFWDIRNNVDGSLSFNGNTSLLPERARITNDGYLRLAASSLGIQFGGDTAAANALDDYEEGTFTPTIYGGTTAGTATYTTQNGRYTKIGNRVLFDVVVTYSGFTGVGDVRISMPLTSLDGTAGHVFAVRHNTYTMAANSTMVGLMHPNANYIRLDQVVIGGGTATPAPVSATGSVQVSGVYASA